MLKKGLSCICQSEGKLFLIFKSFLNHHSVFENSFYTHPPLALDLKKYKMFLFWDAELGHTGLTFSILV